MFIYGVVSLRSVNLLENWVTTLLIADQWFCGTTDEDILMRMILVVGVHIIIEVDAHRRNCRGRIQNNFGTISINRIKMVCFVAPFKAYTRLGLYRKQSWIFVWGIHDNNVSVVVSECRLQLLLNLWKALWQFILQLPWSSHDVPFVMLPDLCLIRHSTQSSNCDKKANIFPSI